MGILADRIEKFILAKMRDAEQDVIIQRKELANELECAPSQITYVLSTRFSNDRGYIVESRRGLGGYVKITQISTPRKDKGAMLVPSTNVVSPYEGIISKTEIENYFPTTLEEADYLIGKLVMSKQITHGEARLLHSMYQMVLTTVVEENKEDVLRGMFRCIINELWR